jgi:hypothetical protein
VLGNSGELNSIAAECKRKLDGLASAKRIVEGRREFNRRRISHRLFHPDHVVNVLHDCVSLDRGIAGIQHHALDAVGK